MNEYKKEEIRNIHYNNKNEIQFEYGGQVHHYRMENLKEVFINCWNLQQENIKLKNWKELHSGLILAKENIRLHEQNKKQKEVIDKLKNKTKENIENAKCEITTLTIGDKAYYQYIEKILDNYVDILKEVE